MTLREIYVTQDMDSKPEKGNLNPCCVSSIKINPQRRMNRERRKIINQIRRLSTIDEMEIPSPNCSVSIKTNKKMNLKRSASGKSKNVLR